MQKNIFIPILIPFLVLVLILTAILAFSSIYSLDDKYYGVITQSGEIVKVVSDPGIHFKLPFIQKVNRIHRIPAVAEMEFRAITKDKNNLQVKVLVFWEVSDPAVYFAKMLSFNTSRSLVSKSVVEYTKKTFADMQVAKLLLCSSEQATNFLCEVDPSTFFHAKRRISKLLEPHGIKIMQIEAKAKIEMP